MAEHHVLAFFQDPGPVTDAVNGLRRLGVPERRIDVLSFMPLPKPPPGPSWFRDRAAPFALLGAVLGVALGLILSVGLFLYYKIDVGGQDIVAVPPSLIVLFETTMLGTMVTTFVGLLILNRFPDFSRPTYDVRITEGQIGVLALVSHEMVDAVEDVLRTAGATDIQRLPPREQDNRIWNRVVGGIVVGGGVVTVVLLLFLYDFLTIPIPTNMDNQPSIAAQEGPRLAAPAAAVPIQGPVLIADEPASAPIAATADSLQRGKVLFDVHCVLCHGPAAKGDGPLAKYFPARAFDLTSAAAQKMSSQDIFLMITQGRSDMPPLDEFLSVPECWDVVNYVRSLQTQ